VDQNTVVMHTDAEGIVAQIELWHLVFCENVVMNPAVNRAHSKSGWKEYIPLEKKKKKSMLSREREKCLQRSSRWNLHLVFVLYRSRVEALESVPSSSWAKILERSQPLFCFPRKPSAWNNGESNEVGFKMSWLWFWLCGWNRSQSTDPYVLDYATCFLKPLPVPRFYDIFCDFMNSK
jgi:hypothetical protein